MTSVAGHHLMVIEVAPVDRHHHLYHLASRLLRFPVVAIEMIFDVAEPAFHSERSGNELHGGNQLLEWHSFKNLNVLVNLFRRFSRPDACSRGQALTPKGESAGQRQSSAHKRKSQGLQHRSIS